MQRHLRLRRNEDFAHLRQAGRVWRHPFLIVSVAPNQLPHNRYGFVIGKRLGTAVVRIRIRRRLREVMRHLHPNIVQGYDIAIIARDPIVGQPYQALYEAVVSTLQKAKLWKLPPGETLT
jgi:ribonuclease P protein component